MYRFLIVFSSLLVAQSFVFGQSRGYASLYSDNFEGSKTASKEPYHKLGYTAAHRTIAFGSTILVRNITNGKTVRLRVNDRCILPSQVAIKLSFAAARDLGIVRDNEAVIELFTSPLPATPQKEVVAEYKTPPTVKKAEKPAALPKKLPQQKLKVTKYKLKSPVRAAKMAAIAPIKWTTTQDGYELYQVAGARLTHEGYGIQLASSQQFDGIMRKIADLQALTIDGILLSVQSDKQTGIKTYKIIIGPFEDVAEAQVFRSALAKKGLYGTFVVNLADQYLEHVEPSGTP